MTRVALPIQFTSFISERAAQSCREDIRGRGWSQKSSGSILAFPREGTVGLRTTLNYIMFQDRGIKPFVMWSLEGKVIPIKDPEGATRFIKAVGVGQPGYVTLPGNVRVWRDQKWKHPGLEPKRFMEDAITGAIQQYQPTLKAELMKVLGGESKI
jgi:hypothetical protein